MHRSCVWIRRGRERVHRSCVGMFRSRVRIHWNCVRLHRRSVGIRRRYVRLHQSCVRTHRGCVGIRWRCVAIHCGGGGMHRGCAGIRQACAWILWSCEPTHTGCVFPHVRRPCGVLGKFKKNQERSVRYALGFISLASSRWNKQILRCVQSQPRTRSGMTKQTRCSQKKTGNSPVFFVTVKINLNPSAPQSNDRSSPRALPTATPRPSTVPYGTPARRTSNQVPSRHVRATR